MVTRKNEKLTVADWTFWMRGDLLPQEQQEVLHFMFTWMQYNSWYSKTYHMKDVLGSVQLSKNKAAQKVYNALKNGFVQSFKMIPYKDEQGSRLGLYGKEKIIARFNSNKNNLYYYLKVVYKIRCNFFHGSKVPSVNNIKLIIWAGQTLDKLLIELKRNGVIDIF